MVTKLVFGKRVALESYYFQIWYEKTDNGEFKKIPVIQVTKEPMEKRKKSYSSVIKSFTYLSAVSRVRRIALKRFKAEMGLHKDRSNIPVKIYVDRIMA